MSVSYFLFYYTTTHYSNLQHSSSLSVVRQSPVFTPYPPQGALQVTYHEGT